nr:PP2C family protein-serine/threonine phosphatase [Frankia sp. CiP3]
MGIAMVGSTLIAVVCDGVSSTPGSGPAARAAAAAATAVLAEAVRGSSATRGQPGEATRPAVAEPWLPGPLASGPAGAGSGPVVLPGSGERGIACLRSPDEDPDHRDPARMAGMAGYADISGEDDEPGYRDPYGGLESDGLQWPASDIPTTPPTAVTNDFPRYVFSPDDAQNAIHAAVAAAQAAVTRAPVIDGRIAPSCTFAAAVITRTSDGGGSVTVGWIGDSRVYLLSPHRFERLSEDDTWAAEAARAGLIPASAVETDRRAHTLTRWLGADAGDVTAHVRVVPLSLPATVLVCTDGLWNYLSRPEDMAAVVGELAPTTAAITVGRHLTKHAIDRGGHDNITVVAARIDTTPPSDQSGGREPGRTRPAPP